MPKTAPSPTQPTAEPPLARYKAKRDFTKTPEPEGVATKAGERLAFVIQKHWASHLHYDFRLELDGVLVSWAVPKGPSYDPKVKRMAIHVEDHPVSYGGFEGSIPEKQYGAGTVIVWDRGTWEPIGDPRRGLADGTLVFTLSGDKMAGAWELVKIAKPGERQEAWLLFKKKDDFARTDGFDVTDALPDSVIAKPLGSAVKRAGVSVPKETKEAKEVKEAMPTVDEPSDGPPAGAVKAKLPDTLSPQLATLAKKAPEGGDWIVEAKFDGYRILSRIERGRVRLFTRNGNDWTDKLGSVAQAVEALGIDSGWLDGEIVVANESGGQDFNALQNAIDNSRTRGSDGIAYFVFDAPFLAGYDLRQVPLDRRRTALKNAIGHRPHDDVRFSDAFDAPPEEVLKAACAMRLEGVILKRRDAAYSSSRNDDWLKLKCSQRQEFVIGGYSDRANSTREVGNLFLGTYEDGKLRYAGAVGTGWTLAMAAELKTKLKALETDRSPFETGSQKQSRWTKRVAGAEHWVRPELVAEATFAEWTPDGHLRHASFQGLRTDKPAKEIVREEPVAPPETVAGSKTAAPTKKTSKPEKVAKVGKVGGEVDGMRVSSPDRVIDAVSGATKIDLVRYYDAMAEHILPHLKGRPVSLVRGPSGVGGELFFQKHLEGKMPGMTILDPSLWPDHASMMEVDTKEALLSAAQMNTIEFHTWNGGSKKIDAPDRMIFDLDPGEGVTWKQIQEGAALTHALLDELGLASFLKTSGGKGLHVVVPLTPKLGWDDVKKFSQALVQHLAKTIPDRFVAKSGGSNRIGKIFVDYLRNGLGATTAVAFSARARPGLGVSMSVAWDDLMSLTSGSQWTIADAGEHVAARKEDPWADYAKTRQTLGAAMKRLGN